MKLDLTRTEYDRGGLDESNLSPDPFAQFAAWYEEARRNGVIEPNAMTLATATTEGRSMVRTVLLKECDERGFVFFTNLESRKARDIAANPVVSLLFPWLALHRQVIVAGTAERVSTAEAEAYFATRPRGSQLGAWASPQSSTITSRAQLEKRLQEMQQKFAGAEVPLPSWWGGHRVVPSEIEFWQGRPSRLHDRFLYTRNKTGGWTIRRLAP